MKLRVLHTHVVSVPLHTRLPFKFGVHVLESLPLAELSLIVVGDDGRTVVGRSSDLLVPKWFEKNPNTRPEEDTQALADSATAAAQLTLGMADDHSIQSVFDLVHALHAVRVGTRDHCDSTVLVRGFGVALVERALIDAACRLADCSFSLALQRDLFQFRPQKWIPETAGWYPSRLPAVTTSVEVRHTIGMLDPLTVAEIPKNVRIEDGLPQALEEDIATYGVRRFKIKLSGDPYHDLTRLRDILQVVEERVGREARFTLDGNEQCHDLELLVAMLEQLRVDTRFGWFIPRLDFIEQPLPRSTTFDETYRTGIKHLARVAPVVIDEADTDPLAFRRAIDLGYGGVSIKACKGIFRALTNRALIDRLHDEGRHGLFQSGEDLTNLASIPLQQDLALQAILGVEHVERNGHHYFRGLDHLRPSVRAELLAALPMLYTGSHEFARLRIKGGKLNLTGVVDAPGLGGQLGSIEC